MQAFRFYKLVALAWQLSGGKLNADCSSVNMEIYWLRHVVEFQFHRAQALRCSVTRQLSLNYQMNILIGICGETAADLFPLS